MASCKELTEMFDSSDIDLNEYLDKTIELKIDDIHSGLNEYIGADGKFTSIVKHVELKMNNEALDGIEIVDTPGLNDPIVSRGELTKKFLGECDVVFLLSYCGQFLTQGDISFMCDTLPNEGIKNIIIVGSKFDSGILDDNKSKDIKSAYNSSQRIYNRQAKDNVQKCLASGVNTEVLKRIDESLPPSYISSMLYSCAIKKEKGIPYSKEEENIIIQLKRHFKDFQDEPKKMYALAGIHKIRKDEVIPLKLKKEAIIAEKNKNILYDNKKVLLRLLEDINIQVLQNRDDLNHYDKNQLEKKLEGMERKLTTMRSEIRNLFDRVSVEAAKVLNDMKPNIDMEIENYVDFNIQSQTEQEHRQYSTGFLGLKTHHYFVDVTTYTASVSDIISNIRQYVTRCKQYSNEEFETMINIDKLESAVKESIIGAFDMGEKDFNENDILIPLEITMKKIQIPKIDIKVSEYEEMIINEFSGASVSGDEIHELKLAQSRTLTKVSEELKSDLDQCRSKIEGIMAEQSATFVDNIIEHLRGNIEMLKKQINDKETALQRYDILCSNLKEYKNMVKEMEMS